MFKVNDSKAISTVDWYGQKVQKNSQTELVRGNGNIQM
jgi:hypothetical protein